ncbi:hypothetical protein GJAV_G00121030 [Gymnothorax javanicus]|nr:hypothetical protein GJAV_G00121030 [Gymnothorax javanicus]
MGVWQGLAGPETLIISGLSIRKTSSAALLAFGCEQVARTRQFADVTHPPQCFVADWTRVEPFVSLLTCTESAHLADEDFAALKAELEQDTLDFQAESWSCAVDPQFLNSQQREVVKRQDVIYELVQTEVHVVRTLKLMLGVYARTLRQDLQMDEQKLERLLPQAQNLLDIHVHFLLHLKERRRECLQPASQCNYAIQRLGDILTKQFSGEWGDRMAESYGEFCSHYSDAISFYKEQLQSNRRFQSTIRKISNMAIVQRLGIPECLLLVTQRITKYPILLERILRNTEAGTAEHEECGQALVLIKDVIGRVDGQVCAYERTARLQDIASRLESKSLGRMNDGRVFRRQELLMGGRRLLHEGSVTVKAASGRLKEALAVLCSNVLLLLQERDLRYSFYSLDGKPSVISLQKLIVREVAHEEKAMFLICASFSEPHMFEIHTSSKEECCSWMALIRQAVESCPDMEDELLDEQEDNSAIILRVTQERLLLKDAEVAQALQEKLQILAGLREALTGEESTLPLSHTRLLLHGDSSHLQQGEQLLLGAIEEVETLQAFLLDGVRESMRNSSCDEDDGTMEGGTEEAKAMESILTSDPLTEAVEDTDPVCNQPSSKPFPLEKFFDGVLKLSQWLYTLQAVVVHQDSHIELQRGIAAMEGTSFRTGRGGRGLGVGGALLEQEKQRNLEQRRAELQRWERERLAQQEELQRWEQERVAREETLLAQEEALRRREEEALRQEEQLRQEQQELREQREQYQHNLERLRESTQAVERERERLELQERMRRNKLTPAESKQAPRPSGLSNGESTPPKPYQFPPLPAPPDEQEDRPPAVPPRRESILRCAPKTELPIHLISTTNQHKQGGVQQRIPTKLAQNKSKERKDKNSPATLDLRQIVPIKSSAREDGNVRGLRSSSPHSLSQPDVSPEFQPPPPHTSSFHRYSAPPLSNKDPESTPKDDVFYF